MCCITVIPLDVGGKMKNYEEYDDHHGLKKTLYDAHKKIDLHGVLDSSWVPAAGNGNSVTFIISVPDGGSSGWRPPKKTSSLIIISVPDGGSSDWRIPKENSSFLIISLPDGGSSHWRPPKANSSFMIISVPDGGSSDWRPPEENSLMISVPDGGSSRWRPPKKLPDTESILSCSSS
ncbi:hypothetical protein CY35_06G128100 [Sphagnum magellanicum]|jgi:hypothetical protein|nr:hypothetical protein CY35_06G128100 [Sphagnum magellanicum]